MRLVNNNKGIEFEGIVYMYSTVDEAETVFGSIEMINKFDYAELNIGKVLSDTCLEAKADI